MENTPFKTLEISEPWYWTNENLSDQLQIELNKDHTLKGQIVKTVARRQDNDDVLLEMEEGKYAVVHLTWQKFAYEDTLFPITEIYKNWQDIFENRILIDVKKF